MIVYFLHIAIMACLYTMLAQSLNLAAGKATLVSLAHAGFYGLGAYTTAILSTQLQSSLAINLLAAMLICSGIAYLVSFIALRTVDDYFIICTLAIAMISFSVFNNWSSVTNGPRGISNIPYANFFGMVISDRLDFLLLTIFFLGLSWLLIKQLFNSGFGRILTAIGDDELFTSSFGKNVGGTKIITFTLSAALASVPGVLYAHYTSFIDPTSFSINESIYILSIMIIGGFGNLKGSFLAAIFMVCLPEILRFIGISYVLAANFRQIIYGLLLLFVVLSIQLRRT